MPTWCESLRALADWFPGHSISMDASVANWITKDPPALRRAAATGGARTNSAAHQRPSALTA